MKVYLNRLGSFDWLIDCLNTLQSAAAVISYCSTKITVNKTTPVLEQKLHKGIYMIQNRVFIKVCIWNEFLECTTS